MYQLWRYRYSRLAEFAVLEKFKLSAQYPHWDWQINGWEQRQQDFGQLTEPNFDQSVTVMPPHDIHAEVMR